MDNIFRIAIMGLGVLALIAAVMIGIQTQNIWISVLIIVGIVATFMAGVALYVHDEPHWVRVVTFVLGSILFTQYGMRLGNFTGGWWWAPVWFFIGLQNVMVGIDVILQVDEKDWIGNIAAFLGALAIVFAFLGPAWLFGQFSPGSEPPTVRKTEEEATIGQTPDQGATEIAGAMMTATHLASSETPLPSPTDVATATDLPTFTPEATETPANTPDMGATEIARAMLTATAEAGGGAVVQDTPQATPTTEELETQPLPGEGRPSFREVIDISSQYGSEWFSSVWGIIYLVIIFLWGAAIVDKWGGAWALALFMLLVLFLTWLHRPLMENIQQAFTSNPIAGMRLMIVTSAGALGSAGWGILITAAGMILFMSPILHILFRHQRTVQSLEKGKGRFGTTFIENYWASRQAEGVKLLLATLVYYLITVSFPILLWISIRKVFNHNPALSLGFLFIPNLALPQWKPIIHYGYFVVPLVMGGINYFFNLQKEKKNIPVQELNLPASLIGPVLLALFVPSGVLLFLTGELLVQSLLLMLPFFAGGETTSTTPGPEPPSEVPWGVSLFKIKSEILDLMVKDWGSSSQNVGDQIACYILDEEKDLFIVKNKKILRRKRLQVEEPLGFHQLSDRKFLVMDRQGKAIVLEDNPEGFSVEKNIKAPGLFQTFTVNSFGTMIAYSSPGSTQIHGLFIETEQDQVLVQDLSQPTCLAFAETGRHLAVGSAAGTVYIVDIATRSVEFVLEGKKVASSPVRLLCPGPDRTWIVVYQNQYLVRWDQSGSLIHSYQLSRPAQCLDVASQNGQVALGMRSGYIHIRSSDLSRQLFNEKVHEGAVEKIIIEKGGQLLASYGSENIVHRINLMDYRIQYYVR